MLNYVCKRLLGLIPTLLIVAVLVFLFVHMLPGDPARLVAGPEADATVIELVRKQLGLDQPLIQQFWHYIGNALQGDFGISMVSRRPVSEEIASRFMPTFWLTIASMLWAVVFGMAIGIVAAVWRNRWPDQPRHGAGGDRHLLPGVRAGDAADADLLRRAGLAADRGRRQLEALHSALDDAGRGRGRGDGALYPRLVR